MEASRQWILELQAFQSYVCISHNGHGILALLVWEQGDKERTKAGF